MLGDRQHSEAARTQLEQILERIGDDEMALVEELARNLEFALSLLRRGYRK